jgi:putative membrane protein
MYNGTYDGVPPPRGRPTWMWVAIGVSIALVAVLLISFLYLAFSPTYGGTGSRPFFGGYGGFFLLFLLVWIVFIVIRIAFWTNRARGGYGPQGRRRDPAVMAARQRYARGEITREQYDQIMTDLGRRGRGPGGPLSGA